MQGKNLAVDGKVTGKELIFMIVLKIIYGINSKKREGRMSKLLHKFDRSGLMPIQEGFADGWDECVDTMTAAIRDNLLGEEEVAKVLMSPSKSKEQNVNFGVVNEYKAKYLSAIIVALYKERLNV